MKQETTGRIEIIRKGRDTILKFNPYHGYHGYFSSRDAHTSFSPGSNAANAARSIANENKRRIAEGNTDLTVNGAYTVTLHGKKATYAEARDAMKRASGKGSGPEPEGIDLHLKLTQDLRVKLTHPGNPALMPATGFTSENLR